MGRNQKHKTEEEKKIAQRKWAREYYHRNKTNINKKTMKEYYENQIKIMEQKLSKM